MGVTVASVGIRIGIDTMRMDSVLVFGIRIQQV